MKTINSLSGGKTSSYMAANYRADYNIFALVRIEADYCKPKDESIVKYASDKIGMDFIATGESDTTLYAMRDLEQLIGSEIIWVTGDSFDELCRKRKALPNLMQRFCTTEMKMMPINESKTPYQILRCIFSMCKTELKTATKFQEDLGADSLDLVELIMELEEEFDIQIPQEEAEKIKTVGEATEFIKKAKNA